MMVIYLFFFQNERKIESFRGKIPVKIVEKMQIINLIKKQICRTQRLWFGDLLVNHQYRSQLTALYLFPKVDQ